MTRTELDADEHAAFVAAVSGCFAERSGPAMVRALLDDPRGDDPVLRDRTTHELGLPGLSVAEELGGAGVGLRLVADVVFEGGRRLVGGSLLPTTLAATVVDRLGRGAAAEDLLAGIADGALTATLALHDGVGDPLRIADASVGIDGPDLDAGGRTGTAAPPIRLSGTRTAVLDGLHADRLVVPVATDGGWIVVVVDGSAPGVVRRALPSLDLTRRIADVTFTDAPARVLGPRTICTRARAAAPDHATPPEPIADDDWQAALDAATVLLAADVIGAAAEAVDRAVIHARERHQFGRPIGSFQAVKHQLAHAHVDVESARAAIEHAAARIDGPDGAEAGALAGLHALRVAAAATRTAIQVHGGIGFTWEHDAQLLHRRTLAAHGLLRPTAALERRLVDAIPPARPAPAPAAGRGGRA